MKYTEMDVFPVLVARVQAQRAAEELNAVPTLTDTPRTEKTHRAAQTLTDIVALFAGIGAVLSIWLIASVLA